MDYTCTFLVYHLETLQSIIIFKNSKNKPRFYLELDSKVQALEISKEKENQRVYY